MLVDLARLEWAGYERRLDVVDPNQLVGFGTSGHRGSSLQDTFTEARQMVDNALAGNSKA